MDKNKFRISFFGEDAFSAAVLRSIIEKGYDVRIVVIPDYGDSKYRKLTNEAINHDIPFILTTTPNADEIVQTLKNQRIDLGVSAHFTKIIKNRLLQTARLGFINLHPSLLPDYRGVTPQHWPIVNREKEVGITVHFIDSGIDTGNIIVQRRYELGEDWYVSDLQKLWLEEYRTIVTEAIEKVINGEPGIPQQGDAGRYYGFLKEEDLELDSDMTVKEAYARIRAFSLPYSGARYHGITIFKAEPYSYTNKERGIRGLHKAEDGKLLLGLSDGYLRITKYKTNN